MLFFSGTTDVSFIDPVVIGRNVFHVTNDFVSGIVGYVQSVLCAIIDVILDTAQGTVSVMVSNVYLIYVCFCNVILYIVLSTPLHLPGIFSYWLLFRLYFSYLPCPRKTISKFDDFEFGFFSETEGFHASWISWKNELSRRWEQGCFSFYRYVVLTGQ